jgi:transcriptional regulator with XRE-family HTH domain
MNKESPTENEEQGRLNLAARLREAREYVGLSQDEVAAALKVSRPAISNIEAGIRKVEALELEKLGRLYGRSVEFLLSGQAASKNDSENIAFLARATKGLSSRDLEELGRFADFLRNSSKAPKKDK